MEPAHSSRSIVLVVLVVAAVVARHNLRKGRGDRRGALRISTRRLRGHVGDWIFGATHFADPNVELDRLFTAIGSALFSAGALWVLYLALEPYVRKFWPTTVISWSRLLAGEFRDPQVGRDVLIGVLRRPSRSCWSAASTTSCGRCSAIPRCRLWFPNLETLSGARAGAGPGARQVVFNAAFNSLWIIFALVAVNLLVRRVWITAIVMVGFLMLTGLGSIDGHAAALAGAARSP